MTTDARSSAELRDRIQGLREAAEERGAQDPPKSFVPDASGGDPIAWCDYQDEGGGDAAEHRGH